MSGVELLMNNHQSLKAEIETREDNFAACLALGKELLARQHYASADIRERLVALNTQRNALLRRWEERWENLQLSEYIALIIFSAEFISVTIPLYKLLHFFYWDTVLDCMEILVAFILPLPVRYKTLIHLIINPSICPTIPRDVSKFRDEPVSFVIIE